MREKADWAQDTFAEAAGVDRSYYGKLERGERQPTYGLILRIAKTLETPAWKIVKAAEKFSSPEGDA